MKDRLAPVLQKVDLLLAELRKISQSGPQFRILHRFHRPDTYCLPGEEIAAISLIHRGREHTLRLPLALRMLFDYLAKHRRVPQNAAQIEAGLRLDAFYQKHGANSGKKQARRISRSAVKEYVRRIRMALHEAFQNAHLTIHPNGVLISERTVGKEVLYRITANVQWEHLEIDGSLPQRP